MGEGAGVLSIDPAVLLLQIVGFAILYLLLRRFLFGPLLGVMNQREREIEEGLERGEQAERQLARIDEERRQVLAEAREEGREHVRQSVREGEQARERMLKDAREDVQHLHERARESLKLEREEAMLELRQQVVDLALLAARQAVLGRLDEDQHRRAIDDFIADLEKQP
jgi:F-type H+-transporting ATPase subunit b